MNSSYRVLKLKSGEEIIAKIKGKKEGKVVLEKPMVFKTTTRNDMFGHSKEITFLKNWLSNTASDVTAIPENFIISWLVPSQDVTRLYDMERNNKKPRTTKEMPETNDPLYNKEVLNKILEELKNMDDNESMNNPPFNPFDMGDKFVFMHMMLPPDIVKEMFEEGLLDFDMVNEEDFSEEINEDKYTGEQTNDPDYGNRWTDWNPDPFTEEYN
jgi:hypothetical protein